MPHGSARNTVQRRQDVFSVSANFTRNTEFQQVLDGGSVLTGRDGGGDVGAQMCLSGKPQSMFAKQ